MSYDNTEAQRPRTRRWRDNRIRWFDAGQDGVIAPPCAKSNEGDSPAGHQIREEGAGRSSPTSATIISFPVFCQEQEGVRVPRLADPLTAVAAGSSGGSGGGGRRPPQRRVREAFSRPPHSGAVEHVRRRGYPRDIAEDAVQTASVALELAPPEVRRDPVRARAYLRTSAVYIAHCRRRGHPSR